ncbi:MFS transporter [Paraburkholderia sp. BCC1885]|uniref:MFS transporter n=1 Tax=Paraburkholderia sp. BCC1885 TaxID=2562669 RepID=UPI0011821280|nr:MFS transporter [Paraburkholderia sp. BCC1885]
MTEWHLEHDTAYERKTLILLSLGFGLVGLDRWIIAPLFPFMMRDLRLGYQELGTLIGVLGLAWGVCSIVMGRLADRIGHKRILVGAMVAFSLLSSFSGLASGFGSLLVIRAVMGFAEGAFTPTSVAAVGEASYPTRRGLNQGIQLSMFSLMGLGFAPILVTQLLRVVPSWHWIFALSAIPGLVIAWLIVVFLRDTERTASASAADVVAADPTRWADLFKSRNVVLAMVAALCSMAGIFVVSAMVPNYLIDFLHLAPQDMGFVMSAIGFGGVSGAIFLSGISDFIGRRPVAVSAFVVATAALYLFSITGPSPIRLFVLLFIVAFFSLGVLGLLTGPVATEAAPDGFVASAVGLVSGAGEVFGGGFAPVIAGAIAQRFGIESTLLFAMTGLVTGALVTLTLIETAPRVRRSPCSVRSDGESVVIDCCVQPRKQ